MTTGLGKSIVCLALALATCFVNVHSAFAASSLLIESLRIPVAPIQKEFVTEFADWQVVCPNPDLKISQLVICTMKPSAAAISGFTKNLQIYGRMIPVKGKKVPVFMVQTGLDLLLPAGVELKIDARKTVKLAFRSCHADGCIVPFQLSGAIKSALQNGNRLNIQVKTLDAKAQQLNLSLIGFTAALQALTK